MRAKSIKQRLRSRSADQRNLSRTAAERSGQGVKSGQQKDGPQSTLGTDSDDYGFLSRPSNRSKEPRVIVAPHSPRYEVDYFDESLFDIGYTNTPKARDSIPVTLGSLSSQNRDSQSGSTRSDMLAQPVVTSASVASEHPYVNIDDLKTNSKFYRERSEGHYARLADLKTNQPQNTSASRAPLEHKLSFYEQKAVEQRARSRSRGAEEERRPRSRSARSTSQPTNRSRSRGRSASRDIMALYTGRPTSAGRMPGNIKSDDRTCLQHSTQNLRPDYLPISKRNNEAQSTKQLRRSESPRMRRSKSRSSTPAREQQEPQNTMTVLEMDVEQCYRIERVLLAANSVKPANIQMMMVATHAPPNTWAARDEVTVKAGQSVTALYKQNEWLYISTEKNARGFVPYAYAKPVKAARGAVPKQADRQSATRSSQRQSPLPGAAKPVTGILKTSQSKQKQRRSIPKYSVKVRTAADNDSLSSETSSAIMEDFVYTRIKPRKSDTFADCIVVDTDDIASKVSSTPNHSEETGTYSSDSGFSDPHSNLGEESDLLHSPTSLIGDTVSKDSGISMQIPTRLPKERIVSVTTHLLEAKPSKSERNTNDSTPKGRYTASPTISDMPLGPLGARLAKIALEKKESNQLAKEKTLRADMKDRARCSSTTPAALRPEIPKDYNGPRVTVVFDYSVENDDDLEVKASDIVTVLNSEDIEWIWVQRRDGKEGFIPRDYVIPLDLSFQQNRHSRVGVSLL